MIEYKIDIYDENNNLMATHVFPESKPLKVVGGVLIVTDTDNTSYGYKSWGRFEKEVVYND